MNKWLSLFARVPTNGALIFRPYLDHPDGRRSWCVSIRKDAGVHDTNDPSIIFDEDEVLDPSEVESILDYVQRDQVPVVSAAEFYHAQNLQRVFATRRARMAPNDSRHEQISGWGRIMDERTTDTVLSIWFPSVEQVIDFTRDEWDINITSP